MDQPFIRRAVAWLLSRQNPDGGWGESCFTYDDPRTGGMGKSTASQTAWALLALMHAGEAAHPSVARGMQFLLGQQNAAGLDPASPVMRKAVDWLVSIQNADGGWGEDGTSYKLDYNGYERAPSTASQTAWALIGLMAAGAADHPAVKRGIDFLLRTQGPDGLWAEERYTATGFPRVFYLRYHGYAQFFPLWALARYRNLTQGRYVKFGM